MWQRWRNRPLKPKIYIIPSRSGGLFLIVNMVVLVSGGTYSNNLVFLLAFIMFSIFISSMVQTHNNLRGIRAEVVEVSDAVSGSPVKVTVRLINTSRMVRQRIEVKGVQRRKLHGTKFCAEFLQPSQAVAGTYEIANPGRGVHKLPRISLSTVYPLGLFYAWSYERPDVEFFVYPCPKGNLRMQRLADHRAQRDKTVGLGGRLYGNDFKEHRAYVPGESFRHVDWKVYARKRVLLKKQYEGEEPQVFSLRYQDVSDQNIEAKLSQLSKWIDDAHKQGVYFELVLPEKRLAPAEGRRHYQRCQRELAKFKVAA